MKRIFLAKCIFAALVAAFLTGLSYSDETAAASESASSLTADIVIGTKIENRDVADANDTFSVNTPEVIGWSRIKGAQEPTEIQHVWKLNGKEMGSVSLLVQSSSFRTYSRKNIYGKSGTWLLEIRDSEGKLIGSKQFEVTPLEPQ